MMSTRQLFTTSVLALLLASLGGTLRSVHAQQAAPASERVIVTVTQVKPEMLTAFDDLMRSVAVPAYRKAGVPWYWTLSTAGPSGLNYRRVSFEPIANFAALDQPATINRALGADGATAYQAKLRQMQVSQRTFVQTLRPDLSLHSSLSALPPRVVMQTLQLINDKGNDFTKVMTDDFLPNYKKSGVKDLWVYATTFGGPANQFMVLAPINKYADLDRANPVQIANQAAAVARRQALIVTQENDILAVVPDLSYGAPKVAP
jgi:hypothetical protein